MLYSCIAVLRCIALYCAVLLYCYSVGAGQGDSAVLPNTARFCAVLLQSRLYWVAGCIGWPGWPDHLVGASLSLAMLSWVPLTVCDVWAVTLTHPCSHMTMTTIDFVRRHSAHTAVLLYGGLYCNTAGSSRGERQRVAR